MSDKRVRIVNDGQAAYMTKITNAETGEDIPHVLDININIAANKPMPSAVIITAMPIVDVIVDAVIRQVCPCCGRPAEEQTELPKENN